MTSNAMKEIYEKERVFLDKAKETPEYKALQEKVDKLTDELTNAYDEKPPNFNKMNEIDNKLAVALRARDKLVFETLFS